MISLKAIWTKGVLPLTLLVALASPALGWHGGETVTPYGDYCPMASRYGKGSGRMMSLQDAKKALFHYYHPRGYSVWIVHSRGRFLKINVIKGKKVVDTIIFDRETGRLRSIY